MGEQIRRWLAEHAPERLGELMRDQDERPARLTIREITLSPTEQIADLLMDEDDEVYTDGE